MSNIGIITGLRTVNLSNSNSFIDISNCFDSNSGLNTYTLTYYKYNSTSLIFNALPASFYSTLICGNINFKTSTIDVGPSLMPKYYFYNTITSSTSFVIPLNVTKVVFLVQGRGGNGAPSLESPNHDGTAGGSGGMLFGVLLRSQNLATSGTVTITSVLSTLSFTGGTTITLTANCGDNGNTSSFCSIGGTVDPTTAPTGVVDFVSSSGNLGAPSAQDFITPSPINNYFKSQRSIFKNYNIYPVSSSTTVVESGRNIMNDTGTSSSVGTLYPIPTYGQGGKGSNPGANVQTLGIVGCIACWFLAS